MPATIINLSAVEESTSRALRYVSEQQSTLNKIDRAVASVESSWESDAQKSYSESFRQSKERIVRFNESVIRSIKSMRKFANDCVQADELTARELLDVNW